MKNKEESFQEIFLKNWDLIIIGITASICFQVMLLGQSGLQKAIFAGFTALILGLLYSSFQWAEKKRKKITLIFLLILLWLFSIPLIKLLIYLLAEIVP